MFKQWSFVSILVAFLLCGFGIEELQAQTQTVTSTASQICGDGYPSGPYPTYTRTFAYTIPAGSTITSAALSGTWGSTCYASSTAAVDIRIEGQLAAQCRYLSSGCYYDGAAYRPWSSSLPSSLFSQLADGSATLTVEQTSPTWVELGTFTLTLTVSVPNNPVPAIKMISPSSTTAGGPDFTLTVTGNNFINGSMVRWNGSDRPTIYDNASQLRATIWATDIAPAGAKPIPVPITVYNPLPGGGTSNSQTFTINPATVTVVVQTMTALRLGGVITVDRTSYTSPQTFSWISGSSHTIATATPQSGGSGTQYVWSNWSDGGAMSHSVAPISNTTYTANFTTQYQLTTAASPASGGSIGVNPTSTDGFYDSGASVQLTATPNSGYGFSGWSGDLTGQTNPQSLTMTGPRAVTANFSSTPSLTLAPYSLSFGYEIGSGMPAGQTVLVKSSSAALDFSAVVRTNAGGGWLSVTPASGTTPGSLTVRVNPEGLATGNYTGTLTVSSAGAANSPQTVPVSLTVSGTLNPKPVISSLSPAGVVAGGGAFDLQVYGNNFVSGSKIQWDGLELADVTFLSTMQLRGKVPANLIASAKVVKVTVWSPEPGGGESGLMPFNVSNPAPVVTGLSLASVIAGRSRYEVRIYGANFLPESVAEWNGAGRATRFADSMDITIMLEAGDIAQAGTGRITVMNPGAVGSNERVLDVVALPAGAPEIQRLIPDTVEAGGNGFALVVEGSGYVAGSVVEWNGQGKVTKYGSGGQLSAEIPASDIARAAESYSVVVRNPVGGAAAQGLWPKDTGSGGSNTGVVSKRNPGPEFTGLEPAAVIAGSSTFDLKVSGGGYVSDKSIVSWNDQVMPWSFVSNTELHLQIPAAYVATEGTVTIEVRNPSPGGGAMTKTFTILPNQGIKTVLLYPRVVDVGGDTTSAESTSIVMANLSQRAAKLTAWAYGQGGQEIQGENITNPVSVTMSPEEQRAAYDYHMFGPNFRQVGGEGWMKLESTEKQVAGFFMMFNDTFTYLDGANASLAGIQQFVFPEVADRGFTEIRVTNPTAGIANVTFELRKADGQQGASAVLHPVDGSGTYSVQLSDLFAGVKAEAGDYVRASSDRSVVPLEYMGEKPKYVYALSGQEVAGGSSVLYGAQYAVVAGQWRTTISVVNLDALPGTVTFRLINDEGMQIGQTKSVAISAFGKVQVTDQDFFIGGDKSGYVEVRSDGRRLVGSVVFGDPDSEAMASSLPLTSGLMTSMVFGHAVSDDTWYTGITLVNPGVADADVTLSLYNTSGVPVESRQMTIYAGSRVVDVLSGSKLFPDLQGRNHYGYMTVTSNQGLAGFALFGTNDLNVLSAIPPQAIPAE
jgi:hypothetical protein